MKQEWYKYLFLLFIIMGESLYAQNPPRPEIDMDKFVQDLFGQQTSDERYDLVYESVFQFYRTPLDLNKAEKEDLENLYILSPSLVNNILKYRKLNGKFLTLYELQAVPGMDKNIFEKILPFVFVKDEGLQTDYRSFWQKVRDEENHYIISRVGYTPENSKGFISSGNEKSSTQKFLGASPAERAIFYTRYNLKRKGDFSFGATIQNDPGEQITWNPGRRQYGFDFYSGHGAIYNKGMLKVLNIGDYQMQIGQGIVMSSGFTIGKGAETVNSVKRSNQGIKPYTGQMEFNFLRGAAATIGFNRFEWTNFYSNRNLDGSVGGNSDSTRQDQYATSIYLTGLHRTEAELAKKGSLNEQIAGSYLMYKSKDKNLKIGASAVYYLYNIAIQRNVSDYNQFNFNGKTNYNIGADFSYTWQNFNFIGEYNRSESGGNAMMIGFVSSLHPKLDFSMLYRRYDPNFVSMYGNSFGELTAIRNEQGIYWGMKYLPHKKINFAAYFDKYNSPWLTSRADAPSEGFDYLLRLNYMPTRKITLYAQWRDEYKQVNLSDNTTPIDYLVNTNRRNYLINLDYKAEKLISLKSRVQVTEYLQDKGAYKTGIAIMQDVNFDFGKFRISTRYAIFDAKDYNTRIYVFEKNVLYAFAMPLYYGQGTRYYVMFQYKVNRNLDLWLRVAQFNYRNQDNIGSGINQIDGQYRTDITVQAKYDF